jgi:hypothetical protein
LVKYEHLYLHEIDDGPVLAEQAAGYQQIYNQQRPHEAIKWSRQSARRTANPDLVKCRPPHTGTDPIRPASLTRDIRVVSLSRVLGAATAWTR